MRAMLLSVLDQSPVRTGSTAAAAVQETLELAEHAERLGYRRYWLAEHHATPGLAGSCPEILIGAVAARTSRIRVGAGGIMLQHYSSLKVAEQFRMLETLHPGRIDLGLGRAPGSDQRTARALRDGPDAYFPAQVADLLGWLSTALAAEHPYHGVPAMPQGAGMPEVWLLGSTDQSAAVAAHLGTAFSFAHFISGAGGPEVIQAYKAAFRPSPWLAAPRASAAVFVVCADTEAEALRLSQSRDLFLLGLYTGRPGQYPSVDEAEAYLYTPRDLTIIAHNRQRTIAGPPPAVRARLQAFARQHDVDELVIVTITHDPKARRRSYELLAEAFDLPACG
jgi:luciferase family oxidoreductase group 1